MRNGESAQYGGVPGYLKRLTIMSLFAAFVAVVGALWSEDWRAKRAGFSSGADKAAAEKSGISDPGVWKARLEADRQERDRLALEEITRNKERVEAEKATKRAMQISVLKTLAATPVKTDVKIDTIGAAKAAIGLWQDFENAARSIPATRRNPRYSCALPVLSSSMRQRNNHEPALSCHGHGGREVRLVFLLFYARTVHDARGLR